MTTTYTSDPDGTVDHPLPCWVETIQETRRDREVRGVVDVECHVCPDLTWSDRVTSDLAESR